MRPEKRRSALCQLADRVKKAEPIYRPGFSDVDKEFELSNLLKDIMDIIELSETLNDAFWGD